MLAIQDFRHALQREAEPMADYLRRLERHFQLAYGRDGLKTETRETMLYSQLQEGLLLSLARSPSVSGCQTYKELCVAAKQEEKRLAGLKRRQMYSQGTKGGSSSKTPKTKKKQPQDQEKGQTSDKSSDNKQRPAKPLACHNCGSLDHFVYHCKAQSKESTGGTKESTGSSNSGKSSGSKFGLPRLEMTPWYTCTPVSLKMSPRLS